MSSKPAACCSPGRSTFELGVAEHGVACRTPTLPEVAFAGRSNVGKSSLINARHRAQQAGARVDRAGPHARAQLLPRRRRLRLVDLPGYGYAKAAKADIERWTALTRDYLRGRAALKRVVLLIDARHGLKPHDKDVMDALDTAAVTYQLVLTKADKLKPTEARRRSRRATRAAIAKRPAAHPEVIATSAETGLGIEQLRAEIAALA